jgi:death on curing protein
LIIYLSKENLLGIHKRVQLKYNSTAGVLNKGHLDSIINAPKRKLFNKEIFPTIYLKAAALMEYVIRLHPFVDGNKRTGLLAAETFLQINGIYLIYPLKAARFSVDIAKSRDDSEVIIPKISQFLEMYSLDKEDMDTTTQKMARMIKEIDDYMVKTEEQRSNLLSNWLAFDIYPEYIDIKNEIISDYFVDLYAKISLFREETRI